MSIGISIILVKYFSLGSYGYTPLTRSHVDTFISFYAHSMTVYSRFLPVCCWAVSCTCCRCRVVGMQVDCHVLRNPNGLGLWLFLWPCVGPVVVAASSALLPSCPASAGPVLAAVVGPGAVHAMHTQRGRVVQLRHDQHRRCRRRAVPASVGSDSSPCA